MKTEESRLIFELLSPSGETEKTLPIGSAESKNLLDALSSLVGKKRWELKILEDMVNAFRSSLGEEEAITFLPPGNLEITYKFISEAYCDSKKAEKAFPPSVVVFFDKANCSDFGSMVVVEKEGNN